MVWAARKYLFFARSPMVFTLKAFKSSSPSAAETPWRASTGASISSAGVLPS